MGRTAVVLSACLVLALAAASTAAPSPAPLPPAPLLDEWVGDWTINMDFQSGTLKITRLGSGCASPAWCDLRMVLERPAAQPVQGEVESVAGNRMVFKLRFAVGTRVDAYLFGDKLHIAGTVTRGDKVFGFFARRL